MPQRCFDVHADGDYDVMVVGGGTTGIAAALAAAREGARTALVEALGFLGGNSAAVPAWLGFHDGVGERVVGGIAQEIVERLQRRKGATPVYTDPICGSVVGIDLSAWKLLALEAVREAGVDTLLHSRAVAVDLKGPAVCAVLCMDRAGLRRLGARAVVDCTDAGDVVRAAGGRLRRGRESDGLMQVASWTFAVEGVNFPALFDHYRRVPGDIRPFPGVDGGERLRRMASDEVFVIGSFRSLIARARREGMSLPRDIFPGVAFPRLGRVFSVATRVEEADPLDARSLTRAEFAGAGQVPLWLDFLRRYVPGFQDCRLAWTPHQIGLRETCHTEGDYTLTADDLMAGRQFDDAIARGGYHMDVHPPDHAGLDTRRPPAYTIPYRCLLPRGIQGLLVAGRCISATHEAMASTRVIPIGMALGQAAGVAAALAARSGVEPRAVPVALLQARLREADALL